MRAAKEVGRLVAAGEVGGDRAELLDAVRELEHRHLITARALIRALPCTSSRRGVLTGKGCASSRSLLRSGSLRERYALVVYKRRASTWPKLVVRTRSCFSRSG